MSGNSGKIEWYLAREGQQHGPLSTVELDKFIELGHLKPTDLLWRAGFDDWRPAADVFPAPAPAPQPPEASQKEPQPVDARPSPQKPAKYEQPQRSLSDRVATQSQVSNERAADPAPEHRREPNLDGARVDATQPQHRRAAVAHPSEPHQTSAADGYPNVGDAQFDPRSRSSGASAATQRPAPHTSPSQFGAAVAAGQPQHPRDAARDQPSAQAEVRTAATSTATNDFDDDAFLDDEDTDGRSGWLMVAAALFILVIVGAGGLFAYNNQSAIAALYSDLAGKGKTKSLAVVRAPDVAARAPAAGTTPERETKEAARPRITAPANTTNVVATAPVATPLPDLPILKSKLWQFAQREFGDWAEKRVAFVRELSAQDKSLEEGNKYLIQSFVKFRRSNAAVALMASPDNLEQVAKAFVSSLQALTTKGPRTCYAFISAGESTPEVAALYFEPNIGPKLEAQMLAILKAIADGKSKTKALRKKPTNEDYRKLQAELIKRGWSAADLNLISDPNALSKAEPSTVCRLVTEWFATQTTLGDQVARDQLIAELLGAVVGG